MKKRPAICSATGSGLLRKPNNEELARPEKIIAFNRCKLFIQQNKKHCKLPCSSITVFPEGEIGDIHAATKKIVDFHFYETEINTFEQAISSAEGMFSHPQKRNKKQSKLLPRYDNYTDEDLNAFIDSIKTEAAKRLSEIILNKGQDDQAKFQVINAGLTHFHILVAEISDAIKSKKSLYAAELMFHAGRLFERAPGMAYAQYTITGIKNRRHLDKERIDKTDTKTAKVEEIQGLIDKHMNKKCNSGQKDRPILVDVMDEYNSKHKVDNLSISSLYEYMKDGLIKIPR